MNKFLFYLFYLFSLFFLIFSPKIFLFTYLLIKYSIQSHKDNRYYRVFDFFIFLYYSTILSFMLAGREYYKGEDVGFGDDLYHYNNAFNWLSSVSFSDFFSDFYIITSLTGSGEKPFWVIVKLISYITIEGFYIHVILTFLGLLIIYLSGQIWQSCGLLFVFLYTNTITFFAYQGSAIRAGLALSFIFLGLSLFLRYRKKLYLFIPPLLHFSAIPVTIAIIASEYKNMSIKTKINFLFLFIFSTIFLYYLALNTQDGGFGFKVTSKLTSEKNASLSSVLQFFIESFLVLIAGFYFLKDRINNILFKSYFFFIIFCILVLLFSQSAFSRFFRYEYVFFVFIFSSILIFSKNINIRWLILCSSFLWFLFIGYTRYYNVFSEDFFEFIGYNIINIV